jgi:hypothetical protein
MLPEKDEKTKKQHEEKEKTLINAILTGSAAEIVQRYGSANKEFLVAYGGIDNEFDKILKKSVEEESRRYYKQLKKITETIKDPQEADKLKHQLLKSHAGFLSETMEVAKENAKRIIDKDPTRRIRMDDLSPEKGGKVNHPLYDHVDLDKNGNPIPGSEVQMKMKGESADEALDKLMGKKNEKYLDNDVKIKVQKDFAEKMIKKADEKIKDLEDQKKALLGVEGKEEDLKKIQRQIDKLEKIKKNVKPSNVTNQESKDIVTKPKTTIAKEIIKNSNKAGLKQAGYGAAIGGSISIVRNLVAVIKEEKKPEDAIVEVAKDTGKAAALSYATGFSGAAIKGAMQNAKNGVTRAAAKTNLPATVVVVTLETGKTLRKFIKGEIDGLQCLEELGEKGTGMVSSALFATIGQIAIPIPVVGGMIGGMLGYALSSACYAELTSALKEAKLAREQRIKIEAECAEAIRMIREYRAELETAISTYLSDHIAVFQDSFDEIKTALHLGDIDGFIAGANAITRKLDPDGEIQFETYSDFIALMESSDKKFNL